MKMVKNIAIVAFATSFMFAGLGFHYANNYTGMDSGTQTASSWGASFDLNETSTLTFDSTLGMMYSFTVPMGVSFRLGADSSSENGGGAGTSVGLGFTWWTGGTGFKTSISTAYDMCTDLDSSAEPEGNLSVSVGFGENIPTRSIVWVTPAAIKRIF